DVTAMLVQAAPFRLVLLVAVGAVFLLLALFTILRWALGRISDAMIDPVDRRVFGAMTAVLIVLFAAQRANAWSPRFPSFAMPVTETSARKVKVALDAIARSKTVPPSPPMESDLTRVEGADVMLVFVESYGAVSYERPELADRLQTSRVRFEADVRATGRQMV